MSWHGVCGHDGVVERFRRALARGRLASSFLFAGPEGIGKRTFALKLAQGLLCERRPEEALDPCEECPGCLQVAAGSHPDVALVSKPKDKSFLPLELLIGDKEHRMRQGLCRSIALKPLMGRRKIGIIDDADFLKVEGANCLLKTLEEPPPRSVLILITTSAARQLPTIRSRCQAIRFRPLSAGLVAELLVREGLVDAPEEARRLAGYSQGSLRQALDLAAPDLWSFRTRLFDQLAQPVLDSVRLSRALSAFVDEAGRQAAARRQRLGQVVAFALGFYRHLLVVLAGASGEADDELRGAVDRAKERWPGDAAAASACVDRCLEAADQIARNANLATLVECWLDDLSRITAGGITATG